jgi:DNA-binding MarR family transcriptional regulator
MVPPTTNGRRAQEVWRCLFGVIEDRWQARFGKDEIDRLRVSLRGLVSRLDIDLPEYLPVLGYGLRAEVFHQKGRTPPAHDSGIAPDLHLPALLSKVLLAYSIEFERESSVSLAISANVVRLIGESGVRVRDLPRLAGVSKEAIKTAVSFLEKQGYIVMQPDPEASRTKLVHLTPKGRVVQGNYWQGIDLIEERWRARFGKHDILKLRESLATLVGEGPAQLSRLFLGLEPHPSGWRASVRKPDTLPHYPMVLHRGGYPDGS